MWKDQKIPYDRPYIVPLQLFTTSTQSIRMHTNTYTKAKPKWLKFCDSLIVNVMKFHIWDTEAIAENKDIYIRMQPNHNLASWQLYSLDEEKNPPDAW